MYVSMTTNATLSPPYPKYGQLSMTLDRRQLATVNLYRYAVTSSSSKDTIHYIQAHHILHRKMIMWATSSSSRVIF